MKEDRPCKVCERVRPVHALGKCRTCYAYEYYKGKSWHDRRQFQKRPYNYCHICLGLFWQQADGYRFCSKSCSGIWRTLLAWSRKIAVCHRCHRLRLTRTRCLCASCYAMSRLEMNAVGMNGACAVRMNIFRNVPGVCRI